MGLRGPKKGSHQVKSALPELAEAHSALPRKLQGRGRPRSSDLLAVQERLAELDFRPVDEFVRIYRLDTTTTDQKITILKELADRVHAKLASVKVSQDEDGLPMEIVVRYVAAAAHAADGQD